MAESDFNREHFENVDEHARQVRLLYYALIREVVKITRTVKYDPEKPFSFNQNRDLRVAYRKLREKFAKRMVDTIYAGISMSWDLSNDKNDEIVDNVFGRRGVPAQYLDAYKLRNLDALQAFKDRKIKGLNLSDRVWNLTEQNTKEMEMAIDFALATGQSANSLATDMRQYLNDPEKLFRRVRTLDGALRLSKAAEAYNPGQGTYRSAWKNAQRLTRTEINMAYREADHIKYQQLDFIVGIEVRRSNNYYECDLCESLKGFYPKEYKFTGNHPNCRCYVVTVTVASDEFDRMLDLILAGKSTKGFKSRNAITSMPQGWQDWISRNRERLLTAKSVPFFIQDNFKDGDFSQGLRFAL